MNILAITAHPDDMEINCAGTLAKCIARGDRVISCHVSNGDMGHVQLMPDVLGPMRIEEAKSAGALAGIEVLYAGFRDLQIYDGCRETRDRLVDVIRYANPDVIITHNPDDYMPDHTAVSRLALDASFAANVPHYQVENPVFSTPDTPPVKMVPVYYMESSQGVGFVPTEYVDISGYMELKLQMLACHTSQVQWLKENYGNDVLERVRIAGRYRGSQCGCTYAECFRQAHHSLRNTTKRLLP